MKTIKELNKDFPSGEDNILFQACNILQRRKVPYYCPDNRLKKLVLTNCDDGDKKE